MNGSQKLWILTFTTLSAYLTTSKYIFDNVYATLPMIIDEQFHIPQGLAYCNGNYTYWDPKITTLPGLYIISTVFLQSYFKFDCNTYNLRFVNLIASCLNMILFVTILKYVYFMENRKYKIALQALSLTILPPLYFFSHVYYTDTLSLTFLLVFVRLCFTSKYKILMLVFGFLSVLMRQTNIAWVAMVLGHKGLDILVKSSRVFGNQYININLKLGKNSSIAHDMDSSKLKRYYSLSDVYIALKYHVRTYFSSVFKFLTLQDWLVLITHSILLVSFVIFVYINGSIVVGDKKAHQATLHLPQLLYFLIFYGVFGLPYVLAKFPSTLKMMVDNKLKILLIAITMGVIVHFNTVVHPYLLADNRHFTFYVWNRWFGNYEYAKYATIPAYIFLLFSLYDNLKDQNCICFLLPYSISLFLVLGLQSLIEIRYFLIPYIILRMRFIRPSILIVMLELLWYIILNALAFHVFFNKEVMWNDFELAQRIIW